MALLSATGIDEMFTGALQLLINRHGKIRFAQVHERVSTQSFVVLSIGNSKSNHLGAQGTFNAGMYVYLHLKLTRRPIHTYSLSSFHPG